MLVVRDSESLPLAQKGLDHARLGVRREDGLNLARDVQHVAHLLGARDVARGERGDQLRPGERLEAFLEHFDAFRRVRELGDVAHDAQAAAHGRQHVGDVSHVARRRDGIRRRDQLGEARGVRERLPRVLHPGLHLIDGRERAHGVSGGALGVVQAPQDALDARLQTFRVVLDAVDLRHRARDATQTGDGLLLQSQGDVLRHELELHLHLGEVLLDVLRVLGRTPARAAKGGEVSDRRSGDTTREERGIERARSVVDVPDGGAVHPRLDIERGVGEVVDGDRHRRGTSPCCAARTPALRSRARAPHFKFRRSSRFFARSVRIGEASAQRR